MIIHSGWRQEAKCNPSYLLYLIMEVRYKRGQAVNKLVDEVILPICYSKRGQTGVEVHYSHLFLILLFPVLWKCLCRASREGSLAQGAAVHTSHLSSLGVNPPPGAAGGIPRLGGQGWCWLCRAIPCHSHCRASPRELCPLPPGALGAAPAILAGCEGLEAARGAQPAPAGEHFGRSWYP